MTKFAAVLFGDTKKIVASFPFLKAHMGTVPGSLQALFAMKELYVTVRKAQQRAKDCREKNERLIELGVLNG